MAKRKKRKKRKNIIVVFKDTIALLFEILWKHINILILIGIVFFVGLGLRYYALNSADFNIKKIEIKNARIVSSKDIVKASGLKDGQNIFSFDLLSIAKRIENLLFVKQCIVERKLPSTILINIVERQVVAQIKMPYKNKFYLIDEDGVVLKVLNNKYEGLIFIQPNYAKGKTLNIGNIFFDDNIKKALSLMKFLPKSKALAKERINSLIIDNADNIIIELSDGISIKVGSNPKYAITKLDNAYQILSPENRNEIIYIDLRFKNIVVKRKN